MDTLCKECELNKLKFKLSETEEKLKNAKMCIDKFYVHLATEICLTSPSEETYLRHKKTMDEFIKMQKTLK